MYLLLASFPEIVPVLYAAVICFKPFLSGVLRVAAVCTKVMGEAVYKIAVDAGNRMLVDSILYRQQLVHLHGKCCLVNRKIILQPHYLQLKELCREKNLLKQP
jgi:hypothetical protein